MFDSVSAILKLEVKSVDTDGTMLIYTTAGNLYHYESGRVRDFNLSFIDIPIRTWMKVKPNGLIKEAAIIQDDSLREANRVANEKATGRSDLLKR